MISFAMSGTGSWFAVIGSAVLVASFVWMRHRLVDFRIRLIGGKRAYVLASNLYSGKHVLPV